MTDKDQLRADVIDAARAYRRQVAERGWPESVGKFHDMVAALEALDAPTPVKPEEVEPGARFRFALNKGGQSFEVFTLLGFFSGSRRLFLDTDGVNAREFVDGALIIPIPEGEEG